MLSKQDVEIPNPRPEPVPVQADGRTRMAPSLAILLALSILLVPSGWFAWKYRSMPQLGSYHDDAILWLSARSLAQDQGYRIPHLREDPAQTKYPPLYPMLLSFIWRFGGAFPQNLSALTALQWLFYPLFVCLVWLFLRRCGFSPPGAWALTVVPALCPVTILLGISPLTEIPFTVVLLGLMLLLESERISQPRAALLAGVLAAAAFLIRTNAIVLIASVPFVLILRRKNRSAVAFVAPLVVAIVGWQAWCLRNAAAAKDDILSYYTSYVGFYIRTFSWTDLPNRMWVNFASLVESLGKLVIFSVDTTLSMRMLEWLLSAAAIAGIVTLYRKGLRQYPLFAALFAAMLVLWQFPPDTRFVYPLFPLYVAGLATKLQEVALLAVATWRQKRGADRVAVVVMLSLIALIAAGSVMAAARGLFSVLPDYFADRETQRIEMTPVYKWIASNTQSRDTFAAYDDPLLYLNTGRHGYTTPLLPKLVYDQDSSEVQRYVQGLGSLWSSKGVAYVLVTKYDFRRDLHDVALDSLRAMVQDRTRFQLLYSDPTAQVYRFSGAAGGTLP